MDRSRKALYGQNKLHKSTALIIRSCWYIMQCSIRQPGVYAGNGGWDSSFMWITMIMTQNSCCIHSINKQVMVYEQNRNSLPMLTLRRLIDGESRILAYVLLHMLPEKNKGSIIPWTGKDSTRTCCFLASTRYDMGTWYLQLFSCQFDQIQAYGKLFTLPPTD